jgi:hypothetical protein
MLVLVSDWAVIVIKTTGHASSVMGYSEWTFGDVIKTNVKDLKTLKINKIIGDVDDTVKVECFKVVDKCVWRLCER